MKTISGSAATSSIEVRSLRRGRVSLTIKEEGVSGKRPPEGTEIILEQSAVADLNRALEAACVWSVMAD